MNKFNKFLNKITKKQTATKILTTLMMLSLLVAGASAVTLGANSAVAWLPLLALSILLYSYIFFIIVCKSVWQACCPD